AGFGKVGFFRLGNRRDCSEILVDELTRLSSIESADDRQRSIVWGVVGLEKLLHIRESGCLDVFQVAVEVVRVVPVAVGVLRHVEPWESTIRTVEDIYLYLISHHALLVLEI